MRVHIYNLGCDKNRVDGEKLAGKLKAHGFILCEAPETADLVIVNTCGFIEPAKKESIDTILSFARTQKVAVTGCLAQRYGSELRQELSEAELVLGLADADATLSAILKRYGRPTTRVRRPGRPLSGHTHSAPLKIAEGCNNHCAYCAIPLIRGNHVSRPVDDILAEARMLRKQGVRELILVAQDITAFGERKGLPGLLDRLCRLTPAFEWVRLMYCHPLGVSDELLEVMASHKNMARYLDMPLQHISDRVLERMNRRYTRAFAEAVIEKVRRKLPGAALRTTFLTGFPGETEADFQALCGFARTVRFERMGAFAYSPEEGTAAFGLKPKVAAKTARERVEELMYLQNDIIFEKNSALIGRTVKVLADEAVEGNWLCRTEHDAPEVDCNVIVQGRTLRAGCFFRATIKDAVGVDLYA